jgi:multisite-specific tRNA:(cytosine-C5)-methyltransferase
VLTSSPKLDECGPLVVGRLVYSTCSLNPLEDESVVAALVARSKGALQLVDVSGHLPGLQRRPGMHNWKVGDVFGWVDTPNGGGRRQKAVCSTMWPPTSAAAAALNLERCVRIFPHLDDTGGFFIVAIDKVRELPSEMEGLGAKDDDGTKESAAAGVDKWNETTRVAPVIAVDNQKLVQSMVMQYGFSTAAGLDNGLMTRRAGEGDGVMPKRLYFVSSGAKDLLEADGGAAGGMAYAVFRGHKWR